MRAGRRWVVVLAGSFALTGALFACGARSGLDAPIVYHPVFDASVPEDDATLDAGIDVETPADALDLTDARLLLEAAPPPRILDCAEAGITYVYVIGEDNELYAFNPSSSEFTPIGMIDCPAPGDATPFSMAVDHTGEAYVVFSSPLGVGAPGDGLLFRVSTKTAVCEPTGFVVGQHGFSTRFGMGFAADPTSPTGETLYVSGDLSDALAKIDTSTFALTPIGSFGAIDGLPVFMAELTGTGSGGLYAFFGPDPYVEGGPPTYIARIDTKTAAATSLVELPDVGLGNGWAFGFWGGDFYTFTDQAVDTSIVTRYRPSDGSIVQVATAPPGVNIVGAGVSTCAPQQ